MPWFRALLVSTSIAGLVITGSAFAQPRGGMPGWGPGYGPPIGYRDGGARYDPREGKVEAAHFVADVSAAGELGRGTIKVSSGPGSMSSGLESATYEAAVIDQLAKAGYTTDATAPANGQLVELVVSHGVVQPEEPPHNPVSGEVGVGVSSRGTAVAMAVDVDLSKPLKALVATRLEVRIRDRSTNTLLWEGHAEVITREGDRHWTEQALAAQLSAALFKGFPRGS